MARASPRSLPSGCCNQLEQVEKFFSASSGLVALIRAEWQAGTFSPGLKAMVS